MQLRAISILILAAAGIVLALCVPPPHQLELSLTGTDAATIAFAHELVESPAARLLDPAGHDRVVHALAIEAGTAPRNNALARTLDAPSAAPAQLDLDEIAGEDVTIATSEHQRALHAVRFGLLVTLGLLVAASALVLVLARRDRRSGLWFAAALAYAIVPLSIFYVFEQSTTTGLALLAFALSAFALVGRGIVHAFRFRHAATAS